MNSAATSSPGEGVYRPAKASDARNDRSPFRSEAVMELTAAGMGGKAGGTGRVAAFCVCAKRTGTATVRKTIPYAALAARCEAGIVTRLLLPFDARLCLYHSNRFPIHQRIRRIGNH